MHSHIYDIGFVVISRKEDASDVTPDMSRAALLKCLSTSERTGTCLARSTGSTRQSRWTTTWKRSGLR
ncbi:MAG: hypothetical protein VR70_12235 [Rhodospirillaceae bacterium BRH_c57]|nr:MAG: hypothetical protein VR70_12235 [Rhodospirillaceae bacterium BRH_c57]